MTSETTVTDHDEVAQDRLVSALTWGYFVFARVNCEAGRAAGGPEVTTGPGAHIGEQSGVSAMGYSKYVGRVGVLAQEPALTSSFAASRARCHG